MKREYIPFHILEEEAVNPNTTVERLQELVSTNKWLIHLVASNPGASPELLESLSRFRDPRVREKIITNPNTPISRLLKLGKYYPEKLLNNSAFYLEYIVNNKPLDIPIETLISLINYDAKLLEKDNNYHGLLSENFFLKLSKSRNPGLISCLAAHPKTPVEILEKLALNKDKYVRSGVAYNPNASSEILEALAQDTERDVVSRVAINPKTPIAILEKLSNDERLIIFVGQIKYLVATNTNTPVYLLERLAEQNDIYLHRYIVKNVKVPVHIIEKLALQHLQYLESSIKDSTREQYELGSFFPDLAANPNTPIHIIEKLATSDSWKLRKAVASSPNAPAYILEKLAEDNENRVHRAIAENSKTPAYILEKISNNRWQILRIIAKNPNTSVELLEKMSQDSRQTIRENAIENLRNRSNKT